MALPLDSIGSLAAHAEQYARMGWLVFPVNPATKAPLVPGGMKSATVDVDQISAWWRMFPTASIAARVPKGFVLLDIDPRHGGDRTWQALRAEHPEPLNTRCHFSGRDDGGGHLWFRMPDGYEDRKLSSKPLDDYARQRGTGEALDGERHSAGIDLLSFEHRYTILPPSLHGVTSKAYRWREAGAAQPVDEMPLWLADLVTVDRAQPAQAGMRDRNPPARAAHDDSIADWYSATHTFADLLGRHGWSLIGGTGDGDGASWRHPRATAATSATVRDGCLFVYSPNTAFEMTSANDAHGYTPFRAFAVLDHAGDLKAAGRAARELRDGPRAATITPEDLFGAEGATAPNPGHVAPVVVMPLGRNVKLTAASTFKLRRVRWLWEGRLPLGALALLAGREGVGKSTVAYERAAAITRGELPGEFFGQPRAVLVCATEDSWEHTITPRLLAHRADLSRVFQLDVVNADDVSVGLVLPADCLEVERAALDVGASLLLLDPLMSRLDSHLDAHRDGEVRQALEPLTALLQRADMAGVGLIHHNKSGSSDPLDLVMASRAFTAVARSVHTVISDPQDETGARRLLGTTKNNLGRIDLPTLSFTVGAFVYDTEDGWGETSRLSWGTDVATPIRDLMRLSADDEGGQTASAGGWLGEHFHCFGPTIDAASVLRDGMKAGYTQRTLQRARELGGYRMTKHGFPGVVAWSMPDDKTTDSDQK